MIIIDASIVNKLVLPLEEGHNKVKRIFQNHASKENIILTFDLVFYEYDMLYAVLAKKHKTTLITADEKFANATKFKFIKLLKDIS